MFWADNHVVSLSINTLLEKENVTLKELLDEEDILQECKSSNKQLVEFLVRPNTIYELIQLIVEEPPDNIDLRQRYKYSTIASEIISSRIPCLSDNLAKEPKIMEKLYSFLDGKPPLNPLLASYFADTIEILFTHSSGLQDWYTYQFRFVHVVEYFKSCPHFLAKFLNHLGTSGIMNSLQFITQFTDNDISNSILPWLDSQQLVEKLISLICGTYTPVIYVCDKPSDTSNEINGENSGNITQYSSDTSIVQNVEIARRDVAQDKNQTTNTAEQPDNSPAIDLPESSAVTEEKQVEALPEQKDHLPSGQPIVSFSDQINVNSLMEKVTDLHVSEQTLSEDNKGNSDEVSSNILANGPSEEAKVTEQPHSIDEKSIERIESNRSANASELICSFISRGRDNVGPKTNNPLFGKCISDEIITQLLESMFSAPLNKRKIALLNGIQVILVLLNDKTRLIQPPEILPEELHRIANIIRPFIPNFLQVLKNPPEEKMVFDGSLKKAVGTVRLSIAHLFMVLVDTVIDELADDLIKYDAFNILLDMFFEYDFNNFLHSSVENILCRALKTFLVQECSTYQSHLFDDCRLLEKLNEAWDKSESTTLPRPGYMGHVIQIVSVINQFDMCCSLASDKAETWQLLKTKLHRALANQNMILGSIHDDTIEDHSISPKKWFIFYYNATISEYAVEDHPDLLDMVRQQMSSDFDEVSNNLFTKMCINRSNPTMDLWTLNNMLNGDSQCSEAQYLGQGQGRNESSLNSFKAYYDSYIDCVEDDESIDYLNNWVVNERLHGPDWPGPNDNVFDDEHISATIPSILDANSSPWNDVTSDDDIQSGWADFGNLQETAGISTVPNTFTCEAFAASQQDDTFELGNDDKFLDEFVISPAEIASDIQRLEQIQADTTTSSTLVIDKPSNENTTGDQLIGATPINIVLNAPSSSAVEKTSDATREDVNKLSESLANVVIQDNPNGSSGDAPSINPSASVEEVVVKCETNILPPAESDAQR